jgi:hypothetical protein
MTIVQQQASRPARAGVPSKSRTHAAAAIAVVLALTGLASGCTRTANDAGATPAASTEGTASSSETGAPGSTKETGQTGDADTKISPLGQTYDGNNIIEILGLTYAGDDPNQAATERQGNEIDTINDNIKSTLDSALNSTSGGDSWAEVRSYPFTSADYLQIVTTSVTYPSYGTEGDVYSWVFDRHTNAWIQPDSVYAEAGLTGDSLKKAVSAAFVPNSPTESVATVEPSAFRYVPGANGWHPEFLIKVTVANQGAEPWDGLYSYTPADAGGKPLTKLNATCLFDPAEMDTMDPPLMYARGACTATGTGESTGS